MKRSLEKLRDWQRRSKPLRGGSKLERGPGPKRKTRIAPVNRKRKKRRQEAGEVYGPYYVEVASMPTCVGDRGAMAHRCVTYPDRRPEAHHVTTVGAGGKDAANLVDVCHGMHDWIHATAPSRVARELGLDLKDEAQRIWDEREEAA